MQLLVVGATEPEVDWAPPALRCVCGIGPVDAAVGTAAALAATRPDAVLHVGIAGARAASRIPVGAVVIGSRSTYSDLGAAIPVVGFVDADPRLVALAASVLAQARIVEIATSARVGATQGAAVEAMEGFGVLRACARVGVPAVELRVVSNVVEESDRAKWRVQAALATLRVAARLVFDAVNAQPPLDRG
jgi:futalosine hydrolase